MAHAPQLNVLALGEETAQGLGSRVEWQRSFLLLISAALSGAAVATAGTIGFVGLIAPHIARQLVGNIHEGLIPVAAITEAVIVIIADLLGRTLLAPIELPCGIITAIIGAPYFVYFRQFFNTLTEKSSSLLSVWGWIALSLAIGLARIITIFTGRITKTQHRFTISSLVRHNLLTGLMARPGTDPLLDKGSNDSISPGAIISFFRDDANQLEDNVVGTNEIFGEEVFAVGSLMLLLSINTKITLLVFLPLVFIVIILQRIGNRLKRYRRVSRQATQQVTSMVGEMFSAVQAIKIANAEESILARLRQTCDHRQQLMVRDRLLTAVLESSFENLVSIGTGVILLLVAWLMQSSEGGGLRQSPSDSLSVGDLALFIYYLSYITYFFAFLGEFLTQTKQSEVSLERMAGLIDSEASGIVAHHPLYLKPIAGRPPEPPQIQSLSLSESEHLQDLLALNLTYCYPGTDRGITSVSLHLAQGSFTVITGQVGSGKTTLLRVLMGLLPMQSGEVYWNKQKVNNPAQFFVPPRSAYTPQVPQLISNTTRCEKIFYWD